MPDGALVIVSMKDQRVLRFADGALSTLADLAPYCGGHLNDLVVDRAGRVFVGDFGFDLMGGGDAATTTLKRIDPDGTISVVADDLHFPNGTVITPAAAAAPRTSTSTTGLRSGRLNWWPPRSKCHTPGGPETRLSVYPSRRRSRFRDAGLQHGQR